MRVDCAVIGAGVVGLAIARAMSRNGMSVAVLEREDRIAAGVSSRNSGVIHAGIYYPPGSLKARMCVEGRRHLYDFCRDRGIPHRRIGKLIFAATADQSAALDRIAANARESGVDTLERIGPAQIRVLEPALASVDCLHSPETGIVDVHAFALALLGEAEDQGAILALKTGVVAIDQGIDDWRLFLQDEAEPLTARIVVNAAGLGAPAIARLVEAMPAALLPVQRYAKGVYFAYSGRHPFRHLIYPLPEPGGLGVHLTLDLAGAARFGPDVEWVDAETYHVPAERHPAFLEAARRIWPEIEADRLYPDYAGVRPKISGPGEPNADFAIQGPETHGLDGLVHLFGIESPGLTSSLAIAEHVRDLVAA